MHPRLAWHIDDRMCEVKRVSNLQWTWRVAKVAYIFDFMSLAIMHASGGGVPRLSHPSTSNFLLLNPARSITSLTAAVRAWAPEFATTCF